MGISPESASATNFLMSSRARSEAADASKRMASSFARSNFRRFQHHRENASDLSTAAARQKSDQIRHSWFIDSVPFQLFDHRMANEFSS